MTKTQLLSLNDYIEDPSSINLKLFVLGVNSNADYKVSELKNLIDKYKKEQSKLRLTAIELYLGRSKGTKISISASKKNIPALTESKTINYLPVGIDKEKLDQLNEMKRKYVNNLKRNGSKSAMEENEILRQKIDDTETEMGLRFDYKDLPKESAEESEKSLLLNILGDWQDSKSISWELLNGQRSYFEVSDSAKQNTSAFGMLGLLKSLTKFSGQPIRPFNVDFVFPQGNAAAKAKWVFSLNPTMNSVQMMTQSLQQQGLTSDLTRIGNE